MRVFAALPVPEDVKGEIARIARLIKERYENVKLVENSNIHLTIHFFGEINNEELERLYSIMDDERLVVERLRASLGKIGFFPSRGNPRVIFIDIDEGKERVYKFHGAFEILIKEAGFEIDSRPFQTHITIARNRFARIDTERLRGEDSYKGMSFVFDRFVLYQSVLHRKGPEYIPLRTVMFR